jgi:hypothetical protein
MLTTWMNNHDRVLGVVGENPALKEWINLSQALKATAAIGIESIDKIDHPNKIDDTWVSESSKVLKEAEKPFHESELMIVEPVKMLFQNALPK